MLVPLAIATPAAAPEPHDTRDACGEGSVPEDGFHDVPDSNVHEPAIDCAISRRLVPAR